VIAAEKRLKRNRLARFISHSSDLETIQALRDTLKQSIDYFGVQSLTKLRADVEHLVQMNEEQRSSPAYPSDQQTRSGFGRIQATGKVTVNNYSGNHSTTTYNNYGTSINCGNVTTTNISNVGNVTASSSGAYNLNSHYPHGPNVDRNYAPNNYSHYDPSKHAYMAQYQYPSL